MNRLHTSLTALSESQLRDVVLRVAAHDPYFCDIIAMELGDSLLYPSDSDTPPPTPIMPSRRSRSYRKKLGRRAVKPAPLSNTFVHFPPTNAAESDQEECCYHPGRLETENYEFLSLRPDGQAYQVVQAVSMWSCCEGEDKSPGCVMSLAHRLQPTLAEIRSRRTHARSKPYLPLRK